MSIRNNKNTNIIGRDSKIEENPIIDIVFANPIFLERDKFGCSMFINNNFRAVY